MQTPSLAQLAHGPIAERLSEGAGPLPHDSGERAKPSANTAPSVCQPTPPHTTGPACVPTTNPPAC
jgi:hypothetical protein